MVRHKDASISTRIPRKLKQQIRECITTHAYMNQSDLIRVAIREKLDRETAEDRTEASRLKRSTSHE